MTDRRYGCRRDLPDHRDAPYRLSRSPYAAAPPPRADLALIGPVVWDQGSLGSCAAHAGLGMLCYETRNFALPSRLQLYYYSRLRAGPENAGADTGCCLRDVLKVLREMGAADERAWPYRDADPGPYQRRPGQDIVAQGLSRRLKSYHAVPSLDVARLEIASGHPVVCGLQVPSGWAGGDLLLVPSPDSRVEGGHAVLAVGYDDAKAALKIRNSWGPGAGVDGYFWMSYSFWQDLAWTFDAWAGRAA